MSAGKGSSRRKGSDDKAFRDNFTNIEWPNKDDSSRFEDIFMDKTGSEEISKTFERVEDE